MIAGTVNKSNGGATFSFKEKITTMQVQSFNQIRQNCWKGIRSRYQEEKSQITNAIVDGI